MRELVLDQYSRVDLYALYHDGRIRQADRVHHIMPALDDQAAFYRLENLFPCSDGSHHEIHDRYRKEDERRVQEELRQYIRRYRAEEAAGGTAVGDTGGL